jgi:hypothetical protein
MGFGGGRGLGAGLEALGSATHQTRRGGRRGGAARPCPIPRNRRTFSRSQRVLRCRARWQLQSWAAICARKKAPWTAEKEAANTIDTKKELRASCGEMERDRGVGTEGGARADGDTAPAAGRRSTSPPHSPPLVLVLVKGLPGSGKTTFARCVLVRRGCGGAKQQWSQGACACAGLNGKRRTRQTVPACACPLNLPPGPALNSLV